MAASSERSTAGRRSLSAPEVAPDIVGIVIGSTFKGLVGGVITGYFARRVRSLQAGLIFGGAVGLFLAFLVAVVPATRRHHYWWEIMLPGTIVGLIVGYATQVYGKAPVPCEVRAVMAAGLRSPTRADRSDSVRALLK